MTEKSKDPLVKPNEANATGIRRKYTIEDFRRKFRDHVAGPSEDPLTLVLEGGSTVTKGRGATLVVLNTGRVGEFRVELRSD